MRRATDKMKLPDERGGTPRWVLVVCLVVLLAILIFGMSACAVGPSVTRTKQGNYHVTAGHSLLAKQSIQGVEIKTLEGDEIRVIGITQDGATVANTYTNWWGLKSLANIWSGHETAKAKEAADVDKAKITTDGATEQARIAADVEKARIEALEVMPVVAP